MSTSLISYRRIDQLKAIAFDRGFTNEDAKQFGKLSKTITWEALLETYGIPSPLVDSVDSSVDVGQSQDNPQNLGVSKGESTKLPRLSISR